MTCDFTWNFSLKQKSDAKIVFTLFRKLVETKFERKINSIQNDWKDIIEILSLIFKSMVSILDTVV